MNLLPDLAKSPIENVTSSRFDWVNAHSHELIAPFIVWAGWPRFGDHIESPWHDSKGKRSLWLAPSSVSLAREWRYKCLDEGCGVSGDLVEMYFQLVVKAGKQPGDWWDRSFQRLYRPLTQDLKQNQSSCQVRRQNAGAKLLFSRNLEPKTTSHSTERCEADQHST
jgi:hypothetical protein